MIIYSLIIISVKIIYQFPIFCGYPFFSIFNIFSDSDSYCDYYYLEPAEIMEEFSFIIGLRKYNGIYSYPKNMGLLRGIIWDVIILCLLLLNKNLLKSKGMWNFIEGNKDYGEIPKFTKEKGENDRGRGIINNIKMFVKRMAPELFSDNTKYKSGYDYYPFLFGSLLIIFVYTLFFFPMMMGKSDQTLKNVLDKQQFSKEYVFTIIIILILIIFDRIIYKLRSIKSDYILNKFSNSNENESQSSQQHNNNQQINNQIQYDIKDIKLANFALISKIISHYLILIFIHIILFIYLPTSTKILFYQNTSLVFLYLLISIYFFFSSLQIKHGFPLYTRGQYLTDSPSTQNRIAFKTYRNIPFLYELRAILDWSITRTSLDLFQWMKIEDAYANLFETRCEMEYRKKRKFGEDRTWYEKLTWGYFLFFFLLFILVLPMILFSSFNPSLMGNNVLSGKFSINLVMRNHENNQILLNMKLIDIDNININSKIANDEFKLYKNSLLNNYDDLDEKKIQKIKVANYSPFEWKLSPPALKQILKNLSQNNNCYMQINWEARREYPLNNKNIMGNMEYKLTDQQKKILSNIILALKNKQNPSKYSIIIKDAFPKIIRLSGKKFTFGKFDQKHKYNNNNKEWTDIKLNLFQSIEPNSTSSDVYWTMNQTNVYMPFSNNDNELTFLFINEDVISSFFGFNSDGSIPFSIVGIYATLVYAVGKFVRMFFDKISQRVIYEEMPNPDQLFELCEGVFIYRLQRNLEKENFLHDLLIRIYRSPETLIKITGGNIKYSSINN